MTHQQPSVFATGAVLRLRSACVPSKLTCIHCERRHNNGPTDRPAVWRRIQAPREKAPGPVCEIARLKSHAVCDCLAKMMRVPSTRDRFVACDNQPFVSDNG